MKIKQNQKSGTFLASRIVSHRSVQTTLKAVLDTF